MSGLGLRAWGRATAITVVLLVHGVAALPLPARISDAELADPTAQDELRRWSERLASVGVSVSPEALGAHVQGGARRIHRARQQLLAPARPVLRVTGTGQAWGLFANPDLRPRRLSFGPTEDAPVFRTNDPLRREAAGVVGYRRVRALYDAPGTRLRATPSLRWLARWLLDRHRAVDPTVERWVVVWAATPVRLPSRTSRRPLPEGRRVVVEVEP